MSVLAILQFAAFFAFGFVGNWWATRHPEFALWWYGIWCGVCIVSCAVALVFGHVLWLAALLGLYAAIFAWEWWRHWRNRKRRGAVARAGAKSRARVAALVRKTRENAKPRPVRQPVPE
jgi:hypothetical protein